MNLQGGNSTEINLTQYSADKQKLLDSETKNISTEFDTGSQLRNELAYSKQQLHEKDEELLFMKRHLLKYEQMITHADEDLAEKQSELELVRASLSLVISERETLKISYKNSDDAVIKLEFYISNTELLLEEVCILLF